jgi:hypothetical protein
MTALQEIVASLPAMAHANGNSSPASAGPANSSSTNEARNAWQRLIDEKLIEWGRHPEQFEDEDGYKAPGPDILAQATRLVAHCRDHGVLPPLRMAPDGEGGIVFDWKNSDPPLHVIAQIHPNGVMEMLEFLDCKLMSRKRIGAETPV